MIGKEKLRRSQWSTCWVLVLMLYAAAGCHGTSSPDGFAGSDAGGEEPLLEDGGDRCAGDDGMAAADGDGVGADGGDCRCQRECGTKAWSCKPTVGLSEPLPVCSTADPCRCVAKEFELDCICEITEPSQPLLCRTGALGLGRGRLDANDGPALTRVDEDGTTRYACLYRPPEASPENPYPLVVWLHGGGQGSADDLYDTTSLRGKADPAQAAAFDLGGQGRPGFILLSVQGRRLHYPTDRPRDGQHHDFYHRDLGRPSTNRDIANLDAWIDTVVAGGGVDTRRIYLMGWSNGCFFSQLYAFARHELGTPGGNRPAAVACYSGADPFENINNGQQPSCKLEPYPSTTTPILLVGRNCDNPTCNQAQAENFLNQGIDVAPGHVVEPWLQLCQAGVAPAMERLILDGLSGITTKCLAPDSCDPTKATFNHIRWPDGKASLDSVDREPEMLTFLRDHPLP